MRGESWTASELHVRLDSRAVLLVWREEKSRSPGPWLTAACRLSVGEGEERKRDGIPVPGLEKISSYDDWCMETMEPMEPQQTPSKENNVTLGYCVPIYQSFQRSSPVL
jgi:hypothetical protein